MLFTNIIEITCNHLILNVNFFNLKQKSNNNKVKVNSNEHLHTHTHKIPYFKV